MFPAAHFTLVSSLSIVLKQPLVKIVLKIINGLIDFLSQGDLIKLVENRFMESFTDVQPGTSSARSGKHQSELLYSIFIRYNPSSYLRLIDEINILASNKGRAYFTLAGYHFNPDDVTRLLGIEPTSVNAAGANSGLDKPVISSWELSTDNITDDVDVYVLTDIIIKQLEPIKEKILQVIKSHNLSPRIGVVLVLSVDKGDSCPDIGFGARTIRFLAEIGAFINVEYQLSKRD